jgi:hypothetical protein
MWHILGGWGWSCVVYWMRNRMTWSPWSGDIYKSLQTWDRLAAFPKTSRVHRLCLCLRRDADGPSRLRYCSRVCRQECDALYLTYTAIKCFDICRPSCLVFVLTRRDSTFLTNPFPHPHPHPHPTDIWKNIVLFLCFRVRPLVLMTKLYLCFNRYFKTWVHSSH